MPDDALIKKLRLQPDQPNLVLNPPPGYLERLGSTPVATAADRNKYAFVHLFVHNQEELRQLAPTALLALRHDGLLWLSYPKISSKVKTDLTRDRGWEPVTEAGLEGVAQVAVDEVWAATRFRPHELVGKNRK
ncbi:hypothetical protein BH24BAC1_BH24BAC1_11930 [soil metagenome]